MPAPPKPASDAAVKRREKQFDQRIEALDKQFDLGFITETQFLKKRRQAVFVVYSGILKIWNCV